MVLKVYGGEIYSKLIAKLRFDKPFESWNINLITFEPLLTCCGEACGICNDLLCDNNFHIP